MDAQVKTPREMDIRVMAPEDCIEADGLRGLVGEVRQSLHQALGTVTVDLSRVQRMNARLLATVLLLARESARVDGRLRLQGVSEEFRHWAGIFHVLGPLEKRGIIGCSTPV